jgi:hypothetical protein
MAGLCPGHPRLIALIVKKDVDAGKGKRKRRRSSNGYGRHDEND